MSKQTSVLIADDEAAMRDACRQVLASDEFLLKEAANGDEALEVVQRESFDLLILDLKMPGPAGWRSCAGWRPRARGPRSW